MIKKVKNTVPWTYVISDLNGEEIIGTFYEKELQETNYNSFNIWIDKKDVIQKLVNIFLNYMNHLEQTLMLKWIYPIMQQKLI